MSRLLIAALLAMSLSAQTRGLFILDPDRGFYTGRNNLTTTYSGYNPASLSMDLVSNIIYQVPDPAGSCGAGPFPVAIWTPGTLEPFNDTNGLTFVKQMSDRCFIAATVAYHNTNSIQNCLAYTNRTSGVFDATRSTSAVSTLCALSGASCALGVVNSGISQGAALAVLAKNYAPNVAATYALSISDYNKQGGGITLACLDRANLSIPSNRLTIVNGASDPLFGGTTTSDSVQLSNVQGYSYTSPPAGVTCGINSAGGRNCFNANGAGWYIIADTQVNDGLADHCYELQAGAQGGCTGTRYDTNWYLRSTFNWGLKRNLEWLATLGTARTLDSSGN